MGRPLRVVIELCTSCFRHYTFKHKEQDYADAFNNVHQELVSHFGDEIEVIGNAYGEPRAGSFEVNLHVPHGGKDTAILQSIYSKIGRKRFPKQGEILKLIIQRLQQCFERDDFEGPYTYIYGDDDVLPEVEARWQIDYPHAPETAPTFVDQTGSSDESDMDDGDDDLEDDRDGGKPTQLHHDSNVYIVDSSRDLSHAKALKDEDDGKVSADLIWKLRGDAIRKTIKETEYRKKRPAPKLPSPVDVAKKALLVPDVVHGVWTCCKNIHHDAPGCVVGDHSETEVQCADCGKYFDTSDEASVRGPCIYHSKEMKVLQYGAQVWDCCQPTHDKQLGNGILPMERGGTHGTKYSEDRNAVGIWGCQFRDHHVPLRKPNANLPICTKCGRLYAVDSTKRHECKFHWGMWSEVSKLRLVPGTRPPQADTGAEGYLPSAPRKPRKSLPEAAPCGIPNFSVPYKRACLPIPLPEPPNVSLNIPIPIPPQPAKSLPPDPYPLRLPPRVPGSTRAPEQEQMPKMGLVDDDEPAQDNEPSKKFFVSQTKAPWPPDIQLPPAYSLVPLRRPAEIDVFSVPLPSKPPDIRVPVVYDPKRPPTETPLQEAVLPPMVKRLIDPIPPIQVNCKEEFHRAEDIRESVKDPQLQERTLRMDALSDPPMPIAMKLRPSKPPQKAPPEEEAPVKRRRNPHNPPPMSLPLPDLNLLPMPTLCLPEQPSEPFPVPRGPTKDAPLPMPWAEIDPWGINPSLGLNVHEVPENVGPMNHPPEWRGMTSTLPPAPKVFQSFVPPKTAPIESFLPNFYLPTEPVRPKKLRREPPQCVPPPQNFQRPHYDPIKSNVCPLFVMRNKDVRKLERTALNEMQKQRSHSPNARGHSPPPHGRVGSSHHSVVKWLALPNPKLLSTGAVRSPAASSGMDSPDSSVRHPSPPHSHQHGGGMSHAWGVNVPHFDDKLDYVASFGEEDMYKAYVASARILKEQLQRERAPGTNPNSKSMCDVLDDLEPQDVVVVGEREDNVSMLLEMLDIKFTEVAPERFWQYDFHLSPSQTLFYTSTRVTVPKDVDKITNFVRRGGQLVSSGWTLDRVVKKAFPGVIAPCTSISQGIFGRVEAVGGDVADIATEGFVGDIQETVWKLPDGFMPVDILRPQDVKVDLRCPQLADRGLPDGVMMTVRAGRGSVRHFVNSFAFTSAVDAPNYNALQFALGNGASKGAQRLVQKEFKNKTSGGLQTALRILDVVARMVVDQRCRSQDRADSDSNSDESSRLLPHTRERSYRASSAPLEVGTKASKKKSSGRKSIHAMGALPDLSSPRTPRIHETVSNALQEEDQFDQLLTRMVFRAAEDIR